MKTLVENKYTTVSLITITLTVVVTSVHHIYRLGLGLLVPSVIVTLLPYLLMQWYAYAKHPGILWAYGSLTAFIFLWFGIIDGFLDHVMKALKVQNLTFLPGGDEEVVQTVFALWSPAAGNMFYEWTGILTFVVGVLAVYYCYRLIQTERQHLRLRKTVPEGAGALT